MSYHVYGIRKGAFVRESDYAYFTRRAAEERAAAGYAHHPLACQSHLDLAHRYEAVAAAAAGGPVLQFRLPHQRAA